MAFHVRLSKHNVLKFNRGRALAFATQADDKRFDRRNVIHLRHCESAYGKWITTKNVRHTSLLQMTNHCPEYMFRVCDARSSYINTTALSKCFSTVVSSQEHQTQDVNEHCRSRSCPCISERSRALEGRKNCLPETCKKTTFLPMTLSDLHFLNNDWHSQKQDSNVSSYVKQVSYTGDDILADNDLCDPKVVCPSVISQENHDVTILNQFLSSFTTSGNHLESSTMFCKGIEQGKEKGKPNRSGPSEEQLIVVEKFFATTLPSFLKSRQDYRIFHKDIIFENNFWGKNAVTQGINSYVMQMNKIRILTHFKYAHAQSHILKITHHPEDGTVRIRWRISGLPQLKTLQIWKFMPWNYAKNKETNSEWHDGFSIMTVGSDGLVHKHRVDRIMPDEDLQTAKRLNLAGKLALLFGVAPKPGLNDFSSLFMKKHMLTPK